MGPTGTWTSVKCTASPQSPSLWCARADRLSKLHVVSPHEVSHRVFTVFPDQDRVFDSGRRLAHHPVVMVNLTGLVDLYVIGESQEKTSLTIDCHLVAFGSLSQSFWVWWSRRRAQEKRSVQNEPK